MRQIESQLPADCVEERSHHTTTGTLPTSSPKQEQRRCGAGHRRGAQLAHPNVCETLGHRSPTCGSRRAVLCCWTPERCPASSSQCMVQDCLSEMPNGKWLKGCQPLCAVKKKCVAAKQCGTILSGVRPSPPPFFGNAKILKTWFYLVWCELRVMDQLLPYTMPCCCA